MMLQRQKKCLFLLLCVGCVPLFFFSFFSSPLHLLQEKTFQKQSSRDLIGNNTLENVPIAYREEIIRDLWIDQGLDEETHYHLTANHSQVFRSLPSPSKPIPLAHHLSSDSPPDGEPLTGDAGGLFEHLEHLELWMPAKEQEGKPGQPTLYHIKADEGTYLFDSYRLKLPLMTFVEQPVITAANEPPSSRKEATAYDAILSFEKGGCEIKARHIKGGEWERP